MENKSEKIKKKLLANALKLFPGYKGVNQELLNDWEYAHTFKNPKEFVKKEIENLRKIKLGFNFSPVHMEWVRNESRLKDSSVSMSVDNIFKWFKSLGCDVGRMEIRIDNYGIKVIINPGLKAARWPEIHISDEILNKIYDGNVPYGTRTVSLKDPLAKFVFSFQIEVYKWIKKNFLKNIYAIQPENEPMTTFGALGWKMSKEYLFKSVENALEVLGDSTIPILLNSPMMFSTFEQSTDVFVKVGDKYPESKGWFIIGVNHYYKHPYSYLFGKEDIGDTYAFTQLWSFLWNGLYKEKERIKKNGFKMITTELQVEPWYPNWKTPGLDFNEFIFVLIRNMKFLNLDDNHKTQVLLWGMEEMYMNAINDPSEELKDIIATIKLINRL